MSVDKQLNLFGLDLGSVLRRVLLGFEQLIWGRESGLREWVCGPFQPQSFEALEAASLAGTLDQQEILSVLIPNDQYLVSEIDIPAEAELYLDEAARNFALSNSPFAIEQLVWGHAITTRTESSLRLAIAFASKSTAEELLRRVEALRPGGRNGSISLWGVCGLVPVPFHDYPAKLANDQYRSSLRQLGGVGFLVLCIAVFTLYLPAMWISQNAGHYEALLTEVREETRSIVEIRQRLVLSQSMRDEAHAFFDRTSYYGPWLHRIAALTPDSVYLNRLSLENERLTISGSAENAADYQASLAAENVFVNLNAPSAFTRDRRDGRERFTLSMELKREVSP